MAGFHLFPWHSVNKFVCFNSNGSIISEVLIICDGSFGSAQSACLRSITGIWCSRATLSRFTTLFMVILDHLYLKVSSGSWGASSIFWHFCLLVSSPPTISGSAGHPHTLPMKLQLARWTAGMVAGGTKLGNTFKEGSLVWKCPLDFGCIRWGEARILGVFAHEKTVCSMHFPRGGGHAVPRGSGGTRVSWNQRE